MTCPYCSADATEVSDRYDDGGYRECDDGHTFHVDDWPEQ